jgi:outer membrane autotransporter protein
VTLTLLRNSFVSGVSSGNLKAVASALDQAGTSGSSDFNNVISSLLVLDTTQGPKALDMLSGQGYAGFANVMNQSVLVLLGNYSNQTGGGGGSSGRIALAEVCDVACDTTMGPRWGAWGGGMGSFGTVAGDPSVNAHGVTYNLGGFLGGLDYLFTNNFRAGVMAGFTAATLYTQDMPGQGWSNAIQMGLYGRYTEGDAYLDGVAGYANADNRMTRQIIFPGVFRTAYGQTSANQFFGQLETGYKFWLPLPSSFLTPFVRLQASTVTQAAFSETGADSLNLNVASQTTNSLRTVLGGQLGGKIETVDVIFRLGWSHEYASTTLPVTASFAGAPTFSFTTLGSTAPRDGAVVGLAANTSVGEATSLYFRYDGEVQGGNTNHTLTAGVRYVW